MRSTSRKDARGDQQVGVAHPARLEREPIGGYLRQQRELRGIGIEELASLTRIPLRSLTRLETGAFDDNVDGFVRGFVRTVAEALGLDADETLSRMLTEPRPEELSEYALSRALPRSLMALALLIVVVAGAGVVRFAITSESTPTVNQIAEQTLYRRDPVRALAESAAAAPNPQTASTRDPQAPRVRGVRVQGPTATPAQHPAH